MQPVRGALVHVGGIDLARAVCRGHVYGSVYALNLKTLDHLTTAGYESVVASMDGTGFNELLDEQEEQGEDLTPNAGPVDGDVPTMVADGGGNGAGAGAGADGAGGSGGGGGGGDDNDDYDDDAAFEIPRWMKSLTSRGSRVWTLWLTPWRTLWRKCTFCQRATLIAQRKTNERLVFFASESCARLPIYFGAAAGGARRAGAGSATRRTGAPNMLRTAWSTWEQRNRQERDRRSKRSRCARVFW